MLSEERIRELLVKSINGRVAFQFYGGRYAYGGSYWDITIFDSDNNQMYVSTWSQPLREKIAPDEPTFIRFLKETYPASFKDPVHKLDRWLYGGQTGKAPWEE